MNKDNNLQKHISILKSAINEKCIIESHDWIRTNNSNIHVLEFEIDLTNKEIIKHE